MALEMFVQLILIIAAVFTLAAFIYPKNVLISLFASLFWFVSSVTATNITILECCGQDMTYTATGTSDMVYFFGFLALIMLIYSIFIILKISQESAEKSKL